MQCNLDRKLLFKDFDFQINENFSDYRYFF